MQGVLTREKNNEYLKMLRDIEAKFQQLSVDVDDYRTDV